MDGRRPLSIPAAASPSGPLSPTIFSRCLYVVPVPLEEAIVLTFGDGSWANARNNRTQAGFATFVTTAQALSVEGGVASLVDWRSHRLRRA